MQEIGRVDESVGHIDETVEAMFTVPYMSLIVSVSPYMGNLLCRCGWLVKRWCIAVDDK